MLSLPHGRAPGTQSEGAGMIAAFRVSRSILEDSSGHCHPGTRTGSLDETEHIQGCSAVMQQQRSPPRHGAAALLSRFFLMGRYY